MKITVETTKTYTVKFDETDKQKICDEVGTLNSVPALKALQTILENPENR